MHFTCYLIGITWKYTRFTCDHMGIYIYSTCYLIGFTWEYTRVSHGNLHVFHMLSHRFHMGIYTCFTCDLILHAFHMLSHRFHMGIYTCFTCDLILHAFHMLSHRIHMGLYTCFTCVTHIFHMLSHRFHMGIYTCFTWEYTRGVTIHLYGSIYRYKCMTIRCIDATSKISISVKRHLYFDTVHIFT